MSSAAEKAQKRASLLLEVTAVTTANSVVTTFSNGSFFPSMGSNDPLDSVGRFLSKNKASLIKIASIWVHKQTV